MIDGLRRPGKEDKSAGRLGLGLAGPDGQVDDHSRALAGRALDGGGPAQHSYALADALQSKAPAAHVLAVESGSPILDRDLDLFPQLDQFDADLLALAVRQRVAQPLVDDAVNGVFHDR